MPPDPPSLSMLPHTVISPLNWKILYKTLSTPTHKFSGHEVDYVEFVP